MKNINSSLFFKANLLLSIVLFLLFLQYNESYSFISFILTFLGAVSSAVILYLIYYILLFVFTFTNRFVLYFSATIFVLTNIALIVDFFIFRLYKFHINAMVLNILMSPDAMDSIQLGTSPILMFIAMIVGFIAFEIYIIKKMFSLSTEYKKEFNQKLNRVLIVPLLLVVLSEKVAYGLSSLFSQQEIVQKFKVIPLYQPLTFSRIAAKYFDYKPEAQAKNTIKTEAALNYPLEEITLDENPNKINIFIFASDAVRNSVINGEVSPNIEEFKKDSIVFKNHYSGGNATRFGIFSMIYGLNSTYWFSFLNASKGPVLFDVLKSLDYQIDIISSTNTNWPEFKKTCYVDVIDSIKDAFEGKPWEKDAQSTKYLLERISKYDMDRPIFNFTFLDSPHGYSFPKEFNKFKASDENIDYLTVSKGDKDIKSIFSRYKNSINYNDKLFGDMIKSLKKRGLYDDALIIYTSDHGQEFYEYGFFGHNSAFSKAQVNSPLIMKLPKSMKNLALQRGALDSLTSHNDVVPTLLSIIGVQNSSDTYSNGKNLFSKDFNREYIFTANWNNNAIVTDKFTYLFSNLPNKMFKNEVRDTTSYKVVEDKKIDPKLVLEIMQSNRRFLK